MQLECTAANAYIGNPDRDAIMYSVREELGNEAIMRIALECTKSTGHYQGYPSSTIELDVFVLRPDELFNIVDDAITLGKYLEMTEKHLI